MQMKHYDSVLNPSTIHAILQCYDDATTSQSAQCLSQAADTVETQQLPCVMTDPQGTCLILQQLQYIGMVARPEKFWGPSNWMKPDDERIHKALEIIQFWERLTAQERDEVKASLPPDTANITNILAMYGFPDITLHALRRFFEGWLLLLDQWAVRLGSAYKPCPAPSTRALEGLFGFARTLQADDSLTVARYARMIERHRQTTVSTALIRLDASYISSEAADSLNGGLQWCERVRQGAVGFLYQPLHPLSSISSSATRNTFTASTMPSSTAAQVLNSTHPEPVNLQEHTVWQATVQGLLQEFLLLLPSGSALHDMAARLVHVLSLPAHSDKILKFMMCTAASIKATFHHFMHPLKADGTPKVIVAWGGQSWLNKLRKAQTFVLCDTYFRGSHTRDTSHDVFGPLPQLTASMLACPAPAANTAQHVHTVMSGNAAEAIQPKALRLDGIDVILRCLHTFVMTCTYRRVWLPLVERQSWPLDAIPCKLSAQPSLAWRVPHGAPTEHENDDTPLVEDSSEHATVCHCNCHTLGVDAACYFDDPLDSDHDCSAECNDGDGGCIYLLQSTANDFCDACSCWLDEIDHHDDCVDSDAAVTAVSEVPNSPHVTSHTSASSSTTPNANAQSGYCGDKCLHDRHNGGFVIDEITLLTPSVPRTARQLVHTVDSVIRDSATTPTPLQHSASERSKFEFIVGWLIRRAKCSIVAGGPRDSVLKLILMLDTSIGSALSRSVLQNGHKAGERLVRPCKEFVQFMLQAEDWIRTNILVPSFLMSYRETAYLKLVASVLSSAVLQTWFREMLLNVRAAAEVDGAIDESATAAAFTFLFRLFCKSRIKKELENAGIRKGTNAGIPVRKRAHTRSAAHGNKSSWHKLKGEWERGDIPYCVTTLEPSKADGMPWGIPFQFQPAQGAEASDTLVDAVVGKDQEKLPISYFSGGLEGVPVKSQRVAEGDRLVRINGMAACSVPEASLTKLLREQPYPRTYLLVRPQRKRVASSKLTADSTISTLQRATVPSTALLKVSKATITRLAASSKLASKRSVDARGAITTPHLSTESDGDGEAAHAADNGTEVVNKRARRAPDRYEE